MEEEKKVREKLDPWMAYKISLLDAQPYCDRRIFCRRFLYTTAPAQTTNAPVMTPIATPAFCPLSIPPPEADDSSAASRSAAFGCFSRLTPPAAAGAGDGGSSSLSAADPARGEGDGDGEGEGGAGSDGGGAGGEEMEREGEGEGAGGRRAEAGEGDGGGEESSDSSAGGCGGREGEFAGESADREGRARERTARRKKVRERVGEIDTIDEMWGELFLS
ncbi:hypothetical protein STAS_11070 [Striga asiatica]|uniref:Uncharacterized protein n=1 Tax=Striga asiatica TaxID=4170 RepID=A0A5A7PQF0_STRAF|nr:hypothetical protein STAS_11070 [Striga asiatica]